MFCRLHICSRSAAAAQRKLAEELYLSRQMLQSVLDNIPELVFWKDRDNRYVACNRAFARDVSVIHPEVSAQGRMARSGLSQSKTTGLGISPEYWTRIFMPLKRLHGREIPGFGSHGGRIWVESELGVGSTFYFTLRKGREVPDEKGAVEQCPTALITK
jgi:PAS domain-containing protein